MFYVKFILTVIGTLFYTVAYGLTSVSLAEFSSNAESRSVFIELSSKAKYTVFSLTNPDRIVIDLEKVDRRSVQKIFPTTKFISGVNGIRIGTPFSGTTRIVLDLNAAPSQLNAKEQLAKHGKERIQIQWEMPVPIINNAKPETVSSSIHEEGKSVNIKDTEPVKVPAKVSQVQDLTSTEPASVPPPQTADANGETLVHIDRFIVNGNTLLDPKLIESLLNPYKGNGRSFADIQFALEALEGAYRTAGYSAVHVITPEQKITDGTITFQVIENTLGKVIIKDNKFYDNKNIRNALPKLIEGTTPSVRELSKNIQLANQNPTRQLDVVMALSEEDDTVNALVNVQDSSPHKVFVTLDNTGTPSTGMYRTGVGYQNNNMFNRDQALTLNYITSPKHVSDVTQVSASYRLPIYSMGDSVDFLAAYSDTNAGTTNVGSPGGPLLSFSGKGDVYGAHYNHYLARRGDYTSKVIGGLDYRLTYSNCILAAAACNNQPPEINLLPFTLSYGGTLSKPTVINDYIASIVHNIPAGAKGGIDVFGGPNGARPGVKDNFNTLHLNETVSGVLPKDWQYRVAGNVQYGDALIPSEKLGLVGANAVRGFQEREFSTDEGYISNFELYTPDIAQLLNIQNGSFRFLGFIDKANGWNKTLTGELGNRINVGSFGLGFRYTQDKLLTFKLDVARVYCKDTDGSTCTSSNVLSKTGDTRGHVSVMANW